MTMEIYCMIQEGLGGLLVCAGEFRPTEGAVGVLDALRHRPSVLDSSRGQRDPDSRAEHPAGATAQARWRGGQRQRSEGVAGKRAAERQRGARDAPRAPTARRRRGAGPG